MQEIFSYFRAEKAESVLFVGAGVLAIGCAVWLLIQHRSALATGLAIPLMAIGLIQLVVGSTVYARSDRQMIDLSTQYTSNTAAFVAAETPRMAAVNRNFDVYKLIEIAFIIIGTGLLFFLQSRDFWAGLGLGMLLQGSAMLSADFFAERRADVYTAFVADASTSPTRNKQ
jgi:hypothetical protein